MKINKNAPVYLSSHAFEPHYNGTKKYIGLDTSLSESDRLCFVNNETKIGDGLTLYTCNEREKEFDLGSFGLNTVENGDFIPDEDTPAPNDAASQTILREVIEKELETLTPREAKVIRLRFGLIDGKTRTLEEVGQEFQITRERIRQIEAKALRKLRHPSRARHLKGFLD